MAELNPRWLRSFTTLCEEGNFTRAAERLNMTQPGMSQHIAKLEQQLGKSLIERDTPGFVLTDAGEKTLSMARARWREEREFLDSLEDEVEDRGVVSTASSGSFAMLLYPSLIAWMGEAPEISARLIAAPEESIVSGVLAGTYDVGIVGDVPRHPRLASEHLGPEPLDLILPLEWEGRPLEFEDLQALGLVQHPDGALYADAVLGANFASEYRGTESLRVRSFVNQIGQIPAPVAQGLAYSILPRSGVLASPQREKMWVASLPQSSVLQLHLIMLKRKTRSPRVEKLARLIREEVGKLTF
ncbi:LysR family transcriptional regulator [Qipengyuania sp. 902]|uniref:LysR family transcriptional regulator n=1 Tax=Qipengyuania sp. 902 TaxID=3417565 RepID=UPI003EB7EBEE